VNAKRLVRVARLALWIAGGFAVAGSTPPPAPYLQVLGIAQDAGIPQAGCRKACCTGGRKERVASLALADPASGRWWLFDATPDFPEQLALMQPASGCTLAGVFLTHAHIGHYTGLVHFGREVMGARGIPVWAMPRMRAFLETNGPWDQLVRLHNIELRPLAADSVIDLGNGLRVTPFLVPHRDEYSETVGFRIERGENAALFVPDIDKWERWDRNVDEAIAGVDVAWLDGTFHDAAELPGRNLSEIPHPLIVESVERFRRLPARERAKIRFIHLNHTNAAGRAGSRERREVERTGMRVTKAGERVLL
jgi:pyrroloquinoline quinone biosynthesis protein B